MRVLRCLNCIIQNSVGHKKLGGGLNKILLEQFIDLDVEFGEIPPDPQGHKH